MDPWETPALTGYCEEYQHAKLCWKPWISSDTDLLKVMAILSDTTFRRSAIDWEDLQPY